MNNKYKEYRIHLLYSFFLLKHIKKEGFTLSIEKQLQILREGSYIIESSDSNSIIKNMQNDLERLHSIDTYKEEIYLAPKLVINLLKNYQKLIATNEHNQFTRKILSHLHSLGYAYDIDYLHHMARENDLNHFKSVTKTIINELDKIVSKYESKKGIASKIASTIVSGSSFASVKKNYERYIKLMDEIK